MTVEPGFGGQEFMVDVMPKIKSARSQYPKLIIQVDGGINEKTAAVAGMNGANAFVAGKEFFNIIIIHVKFINSFTVRL